MGRAAGLTLGKRPAQSASPSSGRNHDKIPHSGHRVRRQPPGALAKRSGSEHWPEGAVAHPAVSARLEDV